MTATREQVIAIAAGEIGQSFAPGTPSKYGAWYGIPTGAFCAMGLSWVADQAGATDIIPRNAWTPSGAQWFRNHGLWHDGVAGIARGDIPYFDFPGAPAGISHVGLVESTNGDGSANTIEFNTNGGRVARKTRKSYIVGYGRPEYAPSVVAAPPAPAAPPVPQNQSNRKDFYQDGDYGYPEVGVLQRVLNAWYPGLTALAVDDNYGTHTRDRVIYLQQKARGKAGLIDGKAGDRVLGFLGIR